MQLPRPVLILVLVTAVQAQGRPDPQPTTPERNRFLEGWMTELLEGDARAAREKYIQAVKGPKLPGFQTELALLRLRETAYGDAERIELVARLEQLKVETVAAAPYEDLAELQAEIRRALDNNDRDALATLREKVRRLVQKTPWYRPRLAVAQGINHLRSGLAERTDPEIESLRQRMREARARNDHRTAWALAWEIRLLQRSNAQFWEASRRLLARRHIEMTRLHLRGEHDRAAEMERLLNLGSSRSRRRSARTADELVKTIREWSPADREQRLRQVQANLTRRLETSPDRATVMLAEERVVMEQLLARLQQFAADKEWEKGLILAARTPYRTVLFRQR